MGGHGGIRRPSVGLSWGGVRGDGPARTGKGGHGDTGTPTRDSPAVRDAPDRAIRRAKVPAAAATAAMFSRTVKRTRIGPKRPNSAPPPQLRSLALKATPPAFKPRPPRLKPRPYTVTTPPDAESPAPSRPPGTVVLPPRGGRRVPQCCPVSSCTVTPAPSRTAPYCPGLHNLRCVVLHCPVLPSPSCTALPACPTCSAGSKPPHPAVLWVLPCTPGRSVATSRGGVPMAAPVGTAQSLGGMVQLWERLWGDS